MKFVPVRVACALLTCLAGVAALTACRSPGLATPATQPVAAAPQPADGTHIDEVTEFYLPEAFPRGSRRPDLLVHFHGGIATARREAETAGLAAVVVTVNYNGLSGAYGGPFSEPGRFERLLADVRRALVDRGALAADATWNRICLSSFSAGYGAVRAILRDPHWQQRIAGVYLADSLYAGWRNDQPYAGVEPAHVAPFRDYARRAAAGECVLLVSHSYYDPKSYAGTHETAQYLLDQLGLTRRAVDEPGPGDMRIIARAGRRSFQLWGCTAPEAAHGRHLANMGWWWRRLPLAPH